MKRTRTILVRTEDALGRDIELQEKVEPARDRRRKCGNEQCPARAEVTVTTGEVAEHLCVECYERGREANRRFDRAREIYDGSPGAAARRRLARRKRRR